MVIPSKLDITYREGTRRLLSPSETLSNISPHFPTIGITRLADVTGLDRIGIHTCCAIRPTSAVLQVSNGKGQTLEAAMASAAMESIELFHAENPIASNLVWCAASELHGRVVAHKTLTSFDSVRWHNEEQKMHWVNGVDAVSDESVWLPAAGIYFLVEPDAHRPSTNGLASGNHYVEAALHGLYELLERDAGYLLSRGGRIRIREQARVIDTDSVDTPELRELIDAIESDDQLVLCRVDSRVPVHTFWAIILNRRNGHPLTMLNPGWGTHRDLVTAASRALTEAAQSRLANIHGAREDITARSGYAEKNVKLSPAYRYFERLRANTRWSSIPVLDGASDNLEDDWNFMLDVMGKLGFEVLIHDLTRPELSIPVIKVIVPGLGFNTKMF